MTPKRKPSEPRKPRKHVDPKHKKRPNWWLSHELIQAVVLRAAAHQMWAEDWVEKALRKALEENGINS